MWIISTNGEEPITYNGALNELNFHQTPRGKSKFKISLCRRKSYEITYIEEILSRFDQFRPVVSHLEVILPNNLPKPKSIGEGLRCPQRQLWKETLFVQYDKNTNISLLSDPIPINYLPEGKKFLCSLIDNSIKEGDCSYAWKFVARHCVNGSYKIKCIDLYQSYSPVAHADSFRINIAIEDMHIITSRIIYVSNASQNTNVPINERVCVSPPPYYLDRFEKYYPNVPINWDDGPFFLQCMSGFQGKKPAGRQWTRLLDAVGTNIKHKEIKIDHTIYIKVLYDVIVSYITV